MRIFAGLVLALRWEWFRTQRRVGFRVLVGLAFTTVLLPLSALALVSGWSASPLSYSVLTE